MAMASDDELERARAAAKRRNEAGRCYASGCGRTAYLRAHHPEIGEVLACSYRCRLDIECPHDADDVTALMDWYGETSSNPEPGDDDDALQAETKTETEAEVDPCTGT